MSASAGAKRKSQSRRPEGVLRRSREQIWAGAGNRERAFSLIEVLVSLTLLAITATGVIPLLITSSRASSTAKNQTIAKSFNQERIDRMRSRQYHIPFGGGAHTDLLDTFYPNNQSAPGAVATQLGNAQAGFIAASVAVGAGRLPMEPQTGAYYRYVVPSSEFVKYPGFIQVVNTQFVTSTGVAYPFGATEVYNNQAANQDTPPTGIIMVSVHTQWRGFGLTKTQSVQTFISDMRITDPTVTAQARALAVRLSGTAPGSSAVLGAGEVSQIVADAAILDLNASVDNGAHASQNAVGAQITQTPGLSIQGALLSAAAPPALTTSTTQSSTYKDLDGPSATTCTFGCFGPTTSGNSANPALGVTDNTPLVGSQGNPVTATLNGAGASEPAMRIKTNGGATTKPELALDSSAPVAYVRKPSTGPLPARSTGYISSTNNLTDHQVTSAVSASAGVIELLPTTFTPTGPDGIRKGLIQVELSSSSLVCSTGTSGASVNGTWSATVSYYSQVVGDYVVIGTIAPGGVDPLNDPANPALDLQVLNDGTTLSNWIAGWSGLTTLSQSITPNGRSVTGELPTVVSINTVTLRPDTGTDTSSGVQVQVGRLSCSAEDLRP